MIPRHGITKNKAAADCSGSAGCTASLWNSTVLKTCRLAVARNGLVTSNKKLRGAELDNRSMGHSRGGIP